MNSILNPKNVTGTIIIFTLMTTITACVTPNQMSAPTNSNINTLGPNSTNRSSSTPLIALTRTLTIAPSKTPSLTPTKIPEIPCETNLAYWRLYPNVPGLYEKIWSGELAKLLHEQKVFQSLMNQKGISDWFNPNKMIKHNVPGFEGNHDELFWRDIYYWGYPSTNAAVEDPEKRNVFPVCGFRTNVEGLEMLVWAQAVPSKESQDGFVFQFITEATPDAFTVNPTRRNEWLSKRLTQLNGSVGGYFYPFYNWKYSIEEYKKSIYYIGNEGDINWCMLDDVQGRIRYDKVEDKAIEMLRDTDYAPKSIETIIRQGNVQVWADIDILPPTPKPLTPFPTLTLVPEVSSEIIENPGFENDSGWLFKTNDTKITGQYANTWASEGLKSYKIALHGDKGCDHYFEPGARSSITQKVDLSNVNEILFDLKLYPLGGWSGGIGSIQAAFLIDGDQISVDGKKGGGIKTDQRILLDGKYQGKHDIKISMMVMSEFCGYGSAEKDTLAMYIDNIRFIYK